MTPTLTFIILGAEAEDTKELGRALGAYPGVSLLMAKDDPEQVYAEATRLRPAAVVLVVPPASETTLKLISRLAAACPTTAVICAARESSPDTILRSMRAGARDFLRLPIIEEEFHTVMGRTAEFAAQHVADQPQRRGKVVAVFSVKGGCGCSLLATNLAVAQRGPTVLFDLNLQSGELELFLGVRPKFSFTDIIENRERLDDALLASYLTPHSGNLSLLAAPPEAGAADAVEPQHVFEVTERLRQRYDYVFIDTPHGFDSVTLSALDYADQVLVVLVPEVHAIRSTRRALDIFDRLGYPRGKVRVVVNRWSKQVELDQQQIERFLGERIAGYVHSDYRAAVNSINLGRPLVESEPSSRAAADIRRLAATLSGVEAGPASRPETRRRSLNSLFRRPAVAEDFGLGAALDNVSLDKA